MQNTEISNKDLNKIEFRNEKKIIFIQSENYLINLFKYLKFKEIYEKRQINSIYFETNNFTDLLDTIDGEKNRSKLRMRWYGKTFHNVTKPILENKIKINNQNYKTKQSLNDLEFKNEISTKEIKKILNNIKILDDELQIKLKIRNPNVLISYDRRYFMYKDIRITLDTNLKSKDFYKKKKITEDEFLIKKKFLIVELKYKDKDFEDVKKITSSFKNRVRKFSKYEHSLIGI